MKAYAALQHWLAAGITGLVLGVVLLLVAVTGQAPSSPPQSPELEPGVWRMLGGSGRRNMVNPFDRDIPTECKIEWKTIPGKDAQGKPTQQKVVDLSQSKNVKWAAALGSRSNSGPVVAAGRVLVGTNNQVPRNPTIQGDKAVLMCFREADGEFLWQLAHDKLPSGQVNDWPQEGLCSTPTVEGDRVYYTSNRCEVVCADLNGHPGTREGKIIWRLDMMKELNVFPHNMSCCSPLVVGDLVFVVTANGVNETHVSLPSPNAPSFLAVDKKTGKVQWQSNAPGKLIMHGQWSNPTYAVVNGQPQVIFPGGDGWLYSFEPQTGELIWKFDANPKDSRYALGGRGTRSDFIAAPVVVGDRLYIGTGQDPEHYQGVGHLWCVDITRTGDVSPELAEGQFRPNPNAAVVWHYGGVVPRGQQLEPPRDFLFGRTMSTCAVHDGLVYAAELGGYLHCLDAETGQPCWVHDLKAAVWSSPYWVDNKVYVATEDGDVWVFAHGKQKPQPKKMEIPQVIRTAPIVVNGVLYVMSESYLYALANR